MTDDAKGFPLALEMMKERGRWLNVRHLLCRWHVYEAIKPYCGKFFKHHYEKGRQQAAMNRFIEAFKNVICALNETQMRALWKSLVENVRFPSEAVEHIRKSYCDHPKALKIMECYVFNCGNLHQTSTSRNEGSHAAFRRKTVVIPKPAEAYVARRRHNVEWIQRLRANAMDAQNRIPHDIRVVVELKDLVGKLSLFALTEI